MGLIITKYGMLLLRAMGQTLLLALLGLFFACIIGLVVGLMSVLRNRACRVIAQVFVDVIRGVPMIVLAYFIYFGVPYFLNNMLRFDITLSALQAGTICLALNCGAYMAEIIRAGIESIDKGHMEAGRSLGLNYLQTMKEIIVPQAIKNILPALGNEFIVLIKETSVAGVIAVTDLTKAAQYVGSATWRILPPLYVAAGCYLIMVLGLTKLLNIFERRLAQGDHN